MAASPSSAAPMSDADPMPSSPAHLEKSFMTAVTEDDDTKMASATPEPSEKPRGKRRAREDPNAQNGSTIGKIKHLKFEDGVPLLRRHIQYDFLRAIFDNNQKVFTNSYEPEKIGKQCFADLYIDTMARSSKTSKVLRDKLLSDREAAKGMAMVCLLVNIGRMNTTLNFFPEMRAQLRTYHAIPSLQANQDPHAYKQLQDAPRLKSILKGGAEDRSEPNNLDELKYNNIPRTNPVNLLFVICQSATKVAELHFPPGREFHDLIMRTNVTSKSRARAFLWLMWFYLESDFTEEGCDENPFGAGVDYGVGVANQGVPKLENMTPEEETLENVDTEEELKFGKEKQDLRRSIILADQQFMASSQTKRGATGPPRTHPFPDDVGPTTGILPRIRPSKHESDLDSVRSTPPPRAFGGRQSGALGSTGRRGGASLKYQIFEASSPAGGQVIEGIVTRKPRPPTAHQIAVERNRSQRVEYILDRGIRRSHHKSRKLRRAEGSLIRAFNRLQEMPDAFDDSEDDGSSQVTNTVLTAAMIAHRPPPIIGEARGFPFRERGFGGLCQRKTEEDDYGEEFYSYGAAIRRAHRRLTRWENHTGPPLGVIAPVKKIRPNGVGGGSGSGGAGGGAGGDDEDYDMMLLDGAMSPPSKDTVDPAETEDEAEVHMRRSSSGHHHRRGHRSERSERRHHQRLASRPSRPKSNGVSSTSAAAARAAAAAAADVDGDVNGDGEGEGEGDGDGEGDTHMEDGDDLDDVDKELLGMAEGDDGEEELDDVDKTLLGMDGDTDSD